MDSKEEWSLSHYLWSLDNALSGLIGLCNGKPPEIADRIIKQVENKLTVWNKHIIDSNELKSTKQSNITQLNDSQRTQDDKKESDKAIPKTDAKTEAPKMTAWGDCSDEDDDDDEILFPEATGLCKPNIMQQNAPLTDKAEDAKPASKVTQDTLRPMQSIENEEQKSIKTKHETEDEEAHATNDEDHEQTNTATNDSKANSEALDICNIEIESILSGPLFIDDTDKNEEAEDTKTEDMTEQKKSAGNLTWAQRTKQKPNNHQNNGNFVPVLLNLSGNNTQSEISSVRSKDSAGSVSSNKSPKKKRKNMPKTPQSMNVSHGKENENENGWSKVYKSKKNKMQRRNSLKMTKSQQQRLSEAEEKKKLQILQRQQKHKEIFEKFNEKIVEKEKAEKDNILQKKKAAKERLKKAEEKRKKTDLLRKAKVIEDDVRREEIRIFQEWQHHEKKSAIVEKQVAAEIRKLRIAQKLTQKLSHTEERVKIIQRKQKELQTKAVHHSHKKNQSKKKRETKSKNKRKEQSKDGQKAIIQAPPPATEERNPTTNVLHNAACDITNENSKYYKENVIENGLRKYFAVPTLNSLSALTRDAFHHFYAKTNKLLANEHPNSKTLFDAISRLLKSTVNTNFEDIHFDEDVLFAMNRFSELDLTRMSFKCSKLSIQCFVLYSVNNIGSQFLSLKYHHSLLLYFRHCIEQYIFNKNESYQSMLAHISLVLSRIYSKLLQLWNGEKNHRKQDSEFITHCIYHCLFEFCRGHILDTIGSVFKSITMNKTYLESQIFDGFMSILIPISNLLKKLKTDTESDTDDACGPNVFHLLQTQMDGSKCAGILHFMSKLIFYDNNTMSNHKQIKLAPDMVILLNGCISYLNGLCKVNTTMLQSHLLEWEMEIYHIFIILLQFTSSNFMTHFKKQRDKDSQTKIDHIRELCKGLLEFITFCALGNAKIQEMFRFISCDKPTLIKQLTQFPFFFFVNNNGKLSLYPTLVAITYNNKQNLDILQQTMNTKLIKTWLKQNIFEYIKHMQSKSAEELDVSLRIFVEKIPIKIWKECLETY